MKKKNNTFLLVIFYFTVTLFSQSKEKNLSDINHYSDVITMQNTFKNIKLDYKLLKSETLVYSKNWTLQEKLTKKEKIGDNSLTITQDRYLMIGNNNFWINADDLYINNSAILPKEFTYDQINQEIEWVPTWYLDVIRCKDNDFKETVYKHAPYLKNKWIDDAQCWWYQDSMFSYPCVFRFQNTYFCLTVDGWGVHELCVTKILKKKTSYYITCSANGFYYEDYEGNIDYLDNFPKGSNGDEFTIRLEFRNNYIYLYNVDSGQLIVELMPVSFEWINKLKTYFNTGHNLFLDGEKDCLDSITLEQTMFVTEALKLRSGEATSPQVLTVMAAGTKVKILELGKAETIDGISSNWVKVEVQAGAKDRDGKPIKSGTIGWCYGGYLK